MSVAQFMYVIIGAVIPVGIYLGITMVPWRRSKKSTFRPLQAQSLPMEEARTEARQNEIWRPDASSDAGQNMNRNLKSSNSHQDSLAVIAIVALVIAGIAAFTSLAGKTNGSDFATAESSCLDWFHSEPELGAYDAFMSDSWEKDGRIVVEVGYDRNGRSYSTRLCVFDPENLTMSAPNNLMRARWE